MFKSIKSIVSYCIVLFLLVFAALFYRQAFLVMLFLIMLILPVFSVIFCKRTFDALKVSITTASLETLKGMTIPLTIQLSNPRLFPLLHVECTVQITSSFYPDKEAVTYILPAGAAKNTDFPLPVTYSHCGLFQIKITSIKAYDYLHFVSFCQKPETHTQVIVLPPKAPAVKVNTNLYTEGFDEYETINQKGNVSSNVTDVREYQPGDKLQKIHWKLSAKIDKLMVKENEQTASHQFFVLLELFYDENRPYLLDNAIEYAYSVSLELIATKENFFFGFYREKAGEFCSYPIYSEDDLIMALCEAYYEMPYTTENLGRKIYEDSGLMKGSLLQATHKGVFDEDFQEISE